MYFHQHQYYCNNLWRIKLLPLLLLLLAPPPLNGINFKLPDVIDSARNIGSSVVNINNVLPSPSMLFDGGKQLIAGYPFEFVSSSINSICSVAVAAKNIIPKETPDIEKMQFQFRTPCKNYSVPLLKAEDLWSIPEFDLKKKVVLLATGWTTTIDSSDTITVLAKAYNCRGDVNFVALDAGSFVDTLYTWSAFNTQAIGEHIAKGLVRLLDLMPVKNIHLIGHSLGAHIVGYAGKHFQELTNQTIPRITGLDPAKPCFNEGQMLSGLQRGYADFIDIIHSNPGVLGVRDPLGDIDFYPGGLDPLPPGCLTVTCAHERAWYYYAESVYPGNERNFLGKRCTSLTSLHSNRCPGRDYPMGYAVPQNIKGNYFLDVNNKSPFGKDSTSDDKNHDNCGVCPK